MNVSLILFLAGWLTLDSFVAGLAIYGKLISMREDDTLHVLGNESHRLKQASLVGWTQSLGQNPDRRRNCIRRATGSSIFLRGLDAGFRQMWC